MSRRLSSPLKGIRVRVRDAMVRTAPAVWFDDTAFDIVLDVLQQYGCSTDDLATTPDKFDAALTEIQEKMRKLK